MGSSLAFEFSPADLWPGAPGDIIRIDETSLRSGLAAHGLEDLTELTRSLLRLHSEDEGLDLRLGAWWLDVRRATLQSIIGSAILVPVCLEPVSKVVGWGSVDGVSVMDTGGLPG